MIPGLEFGIRPDEQRVLSRAYVFHHGGATLNQDPTRVQRFKENEERFFSKWGRERPQRIAWVLSGPGRPSSRVSAKIRQQANEYHKVWVFHTSDAADYVPRHLQVVPVCMPQFLFASRVVGRVLVKKKGFNRVHLVSHQKLGRWLERTCHVQVICES